MLKGVTGSVCFICGLACVSFMDVPDALSIIFACPVVTIFLSALVLRDSINIPKVVAGVALFTGVVCVSKPPFIFQSVFHQITDITERPDFIPLFYLSKQSQDLPQVN